MEPFRDDREALRSRIGALEGELNSRGPTSTQMVKELDELRGAVRETLAGLDRDRARLVELAQWLESLRSSAEQHRARERKRTRSRAVWYAAAAALLVVGATAGGTFYALQRDEPKPPITQPGWTSVSLGQPMSGMVEPLVAEGAAARSLPRDFDLVEMEIIGADDHGLVSLENPNASMRFTFQRGAEQREIRVGFMGQTTTRSSLLPGLEPRPDARLPVCSPTHAAGRALAPIREVRGEGAANLAHTINWSASDPDVYSLDGSTIHC